MRRKQGIGKPVALKIRRELTVNRFYFISASESEEPYKPVHSKHQLPDTRG